MPRSLRSAVVLLVLVVATWLPLAHAGTGSTLDKVIERGRLVLGTSGNMPSMSFFDANGKVTGFDIDLARLMANVMDVKLEIRVMPFDQLLGALEQGDVDVVISNMTITPRRNLRVAFVGPYLTSGKCIVTKDAALAEGDNGGDLNNEQTRLAVLAGSTSEDFARELLPNASLVQVQDYVEAAKLVSEDQASGMLTDYPICMATLKANQDAGFVSVFSLLTYEPIGIALPANDAQFINFTENMLERLDKTNAFEELSKRWFGQIRLKKD
ncbi:MAG: transporter substrate-binding domain-containing protein [Gammaproteobacteria bacterium]|nr:transporter substrate-binding domain-containing protein [Gammaproteobacteria bacterium]